MDRWLAARELSGRLLRCCCEMGEMVPSVLEHCPNQPILQMSQVD